MQFVTKLGALGALLLACSACASAGELERGSFAYICTATEDPYCWDGDMGPRPIPSGFALAAPFEVTFEGVAGGPFAVEPASPQLGVRTPAGFLQLNEAGTQALLAREQPSGFVKDFTLIAGQRARAMHISELRELSSPALESLSVPSGMPTTFFVRVVGDGGALLAGGVTFSYRVEDESVARVVPSPDDSSMFEVTLTAMGMATNVYISTGGTEEVFAIVPGAGSGAGGSAP